MSNPKDENINPSEEIESPRPTSAVAEYHWQVQEPEPSPLMTGQTHFESFTGSPAFTNGVDEIHETSLKNDNEEEAYDEEEDVDTWSPLLPLYKENTPIIAGVVIDGMRPAGKEVFLRFSAKSSLPLMTSATITNERSYKDFSQLHSFLAQKYLANLLPPLPPPVQASRYTDLVFMRPFAIYLERLLKHPVLSRDETFVQFMTANATFMPATSCKEIMAIPMPGKFTELINMFTKPKNKDEKFEVREVRVDVSKSCVDRLMRLIQNLAKRHTLFSMACTDLSRSVGNVAKHESHEFLSRRYNILGQRLNCLADTYLDLAAKENIYGIEALAMLPKRHYLLKQALKYRSHVYRLYSEAHGTTEHQRAKMEQLRKKEIVSQLQVDRELNRMQMLGEKEEMLYKEYRVVSELLERDWDSSEEQQQVDTLLFVAGWARIQIESEKRMQHETWAPLRASYFA